MKKRLESRRILYVYTGNHPVHKAFAETITKNSVKYSKSLESDYDIYFCEGIYAQLIIMRSVGKLNKNAKIITLFADPRLYYLYKRKQFNQNTKSIVTMPYIKALFAKKLLRKLDGAICTGSMNYNLFKKWNRKNPAEIIAPYISTKRFKQLFDVKPKLNNNRILYVGNGPDEYCKGLGILIKTFIKIKKALPDAELWIYGSHWDKNKFQKVPGLYFYGKKDITFGLRRCSLLVHLGQGEGYGIDVLESMLAGVPVIVSDATGARDAVARIKKDFIVPLNEDEASKRIKDYFSMSFAERKKIGLEFKEEAKKYNKKSSLDNFKKAFDLLINKIYG